MTALDLLSALLLGAGSFFCVSGGVGLVRLPDFYTRTHAGGLTDTLGATLVLLVITSHLGGTATWSDSLFAG